MRTLLILCAFVAVSIVIYVVVRATPDSAHTSNVGAQSDIITPISHASALVQLGGTVMYVDPVGDASLYTGKPDAALILITDIHGDHFSTSTLALLLREHTRLIAPQAVMDLLPDSLKARARVMQNGETITEGTLSIEAIPMYNLPDAENKDRHTKGRGNGYLLSDGMMRVYIAGDTAGTPEMRALTNIDIALIPMNLPYTMGVDEAADAVLAFRPKKVYPYHYRSPDGLADVNRFRDLVTAGNANIEVVLAAWYPKN